jgi:hypothetical protein
MDSHRGGPMHGDDLRAEWSGLPAGSAPACTAAQTVSTSTAGGISACISTCIGTGIRARFCASRCFGSTAPTR